MFDVDRALVGTIIDVFEGSKFTDHKSDAGGATRYGVTQGLYSVFLGQPVSKEQVRWLTRDLAIEIIYSEFVWKPKLFHVEDPLVKLCAIDFGINSGAVRGVRSLQYAAFPGPPYDGVMGPKTAAAVNMRHPDQMRRDMLAYRVRFIGKLITAKPSQSVFAAGWANRIAALMELEPGETLQRAA